MLFDLLLYKIGISIVYILFSIFFCIAFSRWGHIPEFPESYLIQFAGYQWMMIIRLPLIWLYNRKKGIGLKYFFFYPVHILILYFVGIYLSYLISLECSS